MVKSKRKLQLERARACKRRYIQVLGDWYYVNREEEEELRFVASIVNMEAIEAHMEQMRKEDEEKKEREAEMKRKEEEKQRAKEERRKQVEAARLERQKLDAHMKMLEYSKNSRKITEFFKANSSEGQ
jgi:flagellar basal body rod protein FlgF